MLIKYGKPVSMKKIGRNIDAIRESIDGYRQKSELCYKKAEEQDKPKCRICGSDNAQLFVSVWGKYDYYQCNDCQAVFLHNLPDVEKMYSGDSTVNGTMYIDDAVYEQRVEMISAPKVKFVLEVCQREDVPVRQWLDIGCGGGGGKSSDSCKV